MSVAKTTKPFNSLLCTAISFIFYETISIQTFRVAFEHFVSDQLLQNNETFFVISVQLCGKYRYL